MSSRNKAVELVLILVVVACGFYWLQPQLADSRPELDGPNGTLMLFEDENSDWCRKARPIIEEFALDRGLKLVAVRAHPDNPEMREYGHLWRQSQGQIPFVVVLDKEDKPLHQWVGYHTREEIEKLCAAPPSR